MTSSSGKFDVNDVFEDVLYLVSLLTEFLNVDVIMKLFQLFLVFYVCITCIEKGSSDKMHSVQIQFLGI